MSPLGWSLSRTRARSCTACDNGWKDRLRGLLSGHGLFENAENVGLLHDQEILAIDLDLGARPLAEQHDVALLQVDRDELARLVAAARADSDDFALRGFLFGGVGDDDAAGGFLLGID